MSKKIHVQGSKQNIYDCFVNLGFENEDDIDKIISYISHNKALLGEDEVFKISQTFPKLPKGCMGLMILQDEYYLNLKYSTILIISLILDIKYTKGFSNAVLGFLGIPQAALIKISEYNGEKCIIRETLLSKEKTGNKNILNKYHGECCNNQFDCTYKNIDKCKCICDNITEIYEALLEKGIFRKDGTNYYYQL